MEKDISERKQSGASSQSTVASAHMEVRTIKVSEVKDIKIPNFSTHGKDRAKSEIVCNLEEEHYFGSHEVQWCEPLFELKVHPNGFGSRDCVSAMVHKLWFSPSYVGFMTNDSLNCTVSVVDVNGTTKFPQSFGTKKFLACGWSCDNFNLRDIGLEAFISHDTLLQNASELLPSDVLTVRYEVFFEFELCESSQENLYASVNDPSVRDGFINSVHWKSSLNMVDSALDLLNHLLEVGDNCNEVFREGFGSHSERGGEMFQTTSDGWEKCLKSLYSSATVPGRSNACYHGGWDDRLNVKASSDKLLEASKLFGEIKRICHRIVYLAKIRLFNLQIFSVSLGLWEEPLEFKKANTLDSVKHLFETREKLKFLADNSIGSVRSLGTLMQITMVNLFKIIEITTLVPFGISFISSLLHNSLFISSPYAILDRRSQNQRDQMDDLVISERNKYSAKEFCIGEVCQAIRDNVDAIRDNVDANCHGKVETDENTSLDDDAQDLSVKALSLRRVMNERLKN